VQGLTVYKRTILGYFGIVSTEAQSNHLPNRSWSIRRQRIVLLSGVVVVGLMIWGLYGLANAPYRPPQDMSTLLDGDEIELVYTLIDVLAVVWLVLAVVLITKLRPRQGIPPAAQKRTMTARLRAVLSFLRGKREGHGWDKWSIRRIVMFTIPVLIVPATAVAYNYFNIDQRLFLKRLGCGCGPFFNTNHLSLTVYGTLMASTASSWWSAVRGLSPGSFWTVVGGFIVVGIVFFRQFMYYNLWL
jgi:hypothetical protein